jgi:hypothetical protein
MYKGHVAVVVIATSSVVVSIVVLICPIVEVIIVVEGISPDPSSSPLCANAIAGSSKITMESTLIIKIAIGSFLGGTLQDE